MKRRDAKAVNGHGNQQDYRNGEGKEERKARKKASSVLLCDHDR